MAPDINMLRSAQFKSAESRLGVILRLVFTLLTVPLLYQVSWLTRSTGAVC